MRIYRLTLTIQGPVLTRSTAIGGYGIDAPVARAADGAPMLAGSHVQGKLRQAWAELNACVRAARCEPWRRRPPMQRRPFSARIDRWLGRADEGERRRRGIVIIGDLRAENPGADDATRSRIAIEAKTGAASESALAVLETPYASGAKVTFVGRVTILADGDEADQIAAAIERGLNWVPQFGGARTVGFGRTLGVVLEREALLAPPAAPEAAPEAAAPAVDCTRLRLVLRFLEPFCISAAPRSANVFDSESTVPGGAVKGALAHQLMAALGQPAAPKITTATAEDAPFAALRRWFDAIRITHAVPVPIEVAAGCGAVEFAKAGGLQGALAPPVDLHGWPPRPRTSPLSLVAGRDGALFDVALSDGPCLIDDTAPTAPIDPNQPSKPHASAPRFAPDWKGEDFARAEALFGRSEPPRALRLRTAMDPHLRAGASEQLFAYEMVLPDRHLWVGEIDLGDVEEDYRQAVVEQLGALTEGVIAGIGKTHAIAVIATISLAGRFILRSLFRLVAQEQTREMFVAILLVVIVTATITGMAGLSLDLGAFLAGVLLAGPEFSHEIELDTEPFEGLLLGLFFMTVGMGIDFQVIADQMFWITASVVGLFAIKSVVTGDLCLAFGLPRNCARA